MCVDVCDTEFSLDTASLATLSPPNWHSLSLSLSACRGTSVPFSDGVLSRSFVIVVMRAIVIMRDGRGEGQGTNRQR